MADGHLEGLNSNTLAFLNLKLDKNIYSNKIHYYTNDCCFSDILMLLCLF